MEKVAVFIDHTNVHYRLKENRRVDLLWPIFYNPLFLSEKLAGNKRDLIEVNFFCTQPPIYMLNGTEKDIANYKAQKSFYSAVEKLTKVNMYYGKLMGTPNNLQEKDLDTQMSVQILNKAFSQVYDTCIIVANDGDYASAVQAIKSYKKRVELVYFRGKCSMHLRSLTDLPRRARRSFFQNMP